jgi:hypothetical protein
MFDPTQRFLLNAENAAAKVMDGEAIIINFANGAYYSLSGAGARLWSLIQSGWSLEECVGMMTRQFDADTERVRRDVERLVAELLREELIVNADRQPAPAGGDDALPPSDPTYESPQLNIYRDLGDLLALDPPTPGLQASPWGSPDAEEGAP